MDLSTKKKLLRGPSKYICCVFRLQSVLPNCYQFLKICSRKLFSKLFFLTESNSFISLYASSGKSSNCFLTYAILYATTFPPLLSTFPPLLSTFPPLLFRFLHYFLILIPSSVVTNLM